MLSVIVIMVPLTVPKLFGYHIYGVLTGSMTPAYSVGSVVYVQACDPEEIQVGDVITFQTGTNTEYVMTHRVAEIDVANRAFVTKGDANNALDSEPVMWERLIGKVVFSVPGLANVSGFVDSTTGKAVLFCAFALAFILWVIADMIAPKRRSVKAADPTQEASDASIKEGINGAIPETSDGQKTGHGRFDRYSVIRAVGVLLIVGALIYLGSTFLQYRKGESEYDALQKLVFAEGEPGRGQNTGGEVGGDNEEHPVSDEVADNREQINQQILQAIGSLREQNEEVIGWIAFDNIDLSYPIMQGEDNTYYLTHTFSGETNSAGSIFMEAGNHSDFNDCHTIIYGHNMKNLSMFGQLKKYKTEEFYEEHQFFTVYTLDQVYRYQIFAYYDISETGDIYTIGFSPDEEFEAFVGNMLRRSYYDTGVDVTAQDKVITLSTCSTEGNRFVINAKRVEE